MRKCLLPLFMIVATFGGAAQARAQERRPLQIDDKPRQDVLAALRLDTPGPGPLSPAKTTRAIDHNDKKLKTLAAVLYASMMVDTKSTFDSTRQCARCIEGDPYSAPFIKAGPVAAYSAGMAFDTGVIYLALKMRSARNPAIRKIWFAIPIMLAVGHAMAARHNYELGRSCAASPGCGGTVPQ